MMNKAEFFKWNVDIIHWAAVEYDFKIVKRTDHHYSLYHPARGRMDYWPSTSKIMWCIGDKKTAKGAFKMDIEAYLMEIFNPKSKKYHGV